MSIRLYLVLLVHISLSHFQCVFAHDFYKKTELAFQNIKCRSLENSCIVFSRKRGKGAIFNLPLSTNYYNTRIRNPFRTNPSKLSNLEQNGPGPPASVASSKKLEQSIKRDIISVSLPALAACIAEPALSMIDTICIGKYLHPAIVANGLAAMSVNSAIFNIIAAITYALCNGTAALVSKAKGKKNWRCEVSTALYSGCKLSIVVGLLFTGVLLLSGDSILSVVFGLRGLDKTMATNYLHIRSLAMPSLLLNLVLTGFSLGMQETIAPVLSISSAFIVNVIGDFVFIGLFGWGLIGAALATSLSSYVAVLLCFCRLSRIYGGANSEESAQVKEVNPEQLSKFRIASQVQSFVNFSYLKSFFSTSSGLFAGSIINTLIYSGASRIASITSPSTLSILHSASHQIAMQTWWFLSYFSTPLSLVGQAVLPRDIAAGKLARASKLIGILFWLITGVGCFCTVANGAILLRFGNLFTSNEAIITLSKRVSFQVISSQFIICVATLLDGIYIGCGLMSEYVQASILSTLSGLIFFGYSIWQQKGLIGAWNGLFAFSLMRLCFFAFNYSRKVKRVLNPHKHRQETFTG